MLVVVTSDNIKLFAILIVNPVCIDPIIRFQEFTLLGQTKMAVHLLSFQNYTLIIKSWSMIKT